MVSFSVIVSAKQFCYHRCTYYNGRLFLHMCVSVHGGGGYPCFFSGLWGGGTPLVLPLFLLEGFRDTSLPDRMGHPLSQPGTGYGYPFPSLSTARTGYAAGGAPVAVTQGDFLVFIYILQVDSTVRMKLNNTLVVLQGTRCL